MYNLTKEVMAPSTFVYLLAGLCKNYWTDLHFVEDLGMTRGRALTFCCVDLGEGADPFFLSLSLTLRDTAFLNIFIDFSENNSWMLMKRSVVFRGLIFISVCTLGQIQIKIQIQWI